MMMRSRIVVGACRATVGTASAQEAQSNDERIALYRIPPPVRAAAEKEAPGARFDRACGTGRDDFRLQGRGDDKAVHSVEVTRGEDGAVKFERRRRTDRDVTEAKLPAPVKATLKAELARERTFAGYYPGPIALTKTDLRLARISEVDDHDARRDEVADSTDDEMFGSTTANLFPTIRITPDGKLLSFDTSFLPSPDDYSHREPLAPKDVPPAVTRAITGAVPGMVVARVLRVTDKGSTDVRYEAFGRTRDDRGAEVSVGEFNRAMDVAIACPLADVPRSVLDAIGKEATTDKQLVSFRPTEARRLTLMMGNKFWQLFGDDPDSKPIDVRVRVDGSAPLLVSNDSAEVRREEAGILPPRPQAAPQ